MKLESITVIASIAAITIPIITTAYNVGQLRQKIITLVEQFCDHKKDHAILDNRLDKISQDVCYLKGRTSTILDQKQV